MIAEESTDDREKAVMMRMVFSDDPGRVVMITKKYTDIPGRADMIRKSVTSATVGTASPQAAAAEEASKAQRGTDGL